MKVENIASTEPCINTPSRQQHFAARTETTSMGTFGYDIKINKF